jgi:radical SAM protein (TIGR01212 family)
LTPRRRYRAFADFLRRRFGTRVWRVTLDGGFTCPNVDGTVAKGGCVFCDNRSFSPNRRLPRASIAAQLERGIEALTRRYGAERFLAYFQAATNTYAPLDRLRGLYDEACAHPQVVGLAIGTRPDCVPDDVLDLIESYAPSKYVCLELGLQTMHDRSLDWMNRGHHLDAFLDAVQRCRGRAFDVCVHLILGLPGESREDMLATIELVAQLPVQAVKIHNLHVVKDTPLEAMHRAGAARMLEREAYVSLVCEAIERLPDSIVLQRLSGDAPPDYLVAPAWCLDKQSLLRAIDAELERRDSWQGKLWTPAPALLQAVHRQPLPLLGEPDSLARASR